MKKATGTSRSAGSEKHVPIIIKSYLSEDVIKSDILPLLPVKSLLKFRCVSKSWCSFISSDKYFLKSHQKNSICDKSLSHHVIIAYRQNRFVQCPLRSWYVEPSTFAADDGVFTVIKDDAITQLQGSSTNVRLVGSCNGLCCLEIVRKLEFILWNPATRKLHKLPDLSRNLNIVPGSRWSNIPGSDWSSLAGFGFDEANNDYKVLVLHYSRVFVARLYSTRTNSWKTVKHDFANYTVFLGESKFVKGKLHWLTKFQGYHSRVCNISYFDLESEAFGLVEEPNRDVQYWYKLQRIGVLDECLSCILETSGKIEVWVMKEYGLQGSWQQVANIRNISGIRPFCDDIINYIPFWKTQSGDVLFCHYRGRLAVYESKSESNKFFSCSFDCPNVYIESLVSPFPIADIPLTGESAQTH